MVSEGSGGPRRATLYRRLATSATEGDLDLPHETRKQLKQLASAVKQRAGLDTPGFGRNGRGVIALFHGPPGTGKTMAAQILANDLELDLYKVNLSAIVSKYIGETEKNLRRVFDAAETGAAVLLFDEADALFAKRTQVKDSHDRYANIEINNLLQHMKDHPGLMILTTSSDKTIDEAFTRRLQFLIRFPGQPSPTTKRKTP